MRDAVVFDMDGTLLSGDSTKVWLVKQLKSNLFRFAAAVIVTPIAIPLMKIKKYKYLGASLYVWIATCGLDEKKLEKCFEDFASQIKENTVNELYWFQDGISEINKHLNENRRVIIATAAPEQLSFALFKIMGLDVEVVGTPLKKRIRGWVSGTHCRHVEKVKRLQMINIKPYWFATYSDDIQEDYPILINSKYPFLVNNNQPSNTSKELGHICYVEWR